SGSDGPRRHIHGYGYGVLKILKTQFWGFTVALTAFTDVDHAAVKTQDVVLLKLMREALVEPSPSWSKIDEEHLDSGETNVKQYDLWEELPLNVCVAMNSQENISVESLPEHEAWILFTNVVGEQVETDAEFNEIAKKIIGECVLRNHVTRDITPEVKRAFFNHLKLSYNYLESEEAKSCFLLCSMFPEDANIELENLVQYGIGLDKFDDLQSIEDARNRVQIAVNTLKSSFLLFDGDGKGTTKMHDVVRDMALLIASEGSDKIEVMSGKGLSQWHPRNATESYIGISLMRNKICKLPDHEFHFPHLDSFLIPDNELESIPDKFIRAIKNVKVLDMKDNEISSLPQSFNLLTKLCMLNLSGNHYIDEISILGELKNLQILILNRTEIEEIPKEIGQLTKLRTYRA
nr:NB-ARC domains-containing protein [Tanacetum cinerariifolium]